MKHTLPVVLTLFAPALPLLAACSGTHHAAVIDREVELITAMQRKDMATLESVMAPDFRLTLEEIPPFALTIDEGNPAPGLPGWRWRANLGSMTFGQIEIAGVDAISIADDLIAVNMTMTLDEWVSDGPAGPEDISGIYDLTDVWVNRDGEWRVISRYSRPRPDAQRPRPDFVFNSAKE